MLHTICHCCVADRQQSFGTQVVREPDGSVSAYSWSQDAATWEKIGTVVEGPQAGECRESTVFASHGTLKTMLLYAMWESL